MSDLNPLDELAHAIEDAEAIAPPLADEPPFTLDAEPVIVTEHQPELFNS